MLIKLRNYSKQNSTIIFTPKYASIVMKVFQGFEIDDSGLLVRTSEEGIQIDAPHFMKYLIVYINQ